ncbi:DUF1642 domain-containing protein [Streptococcus suis]|uniref:DUF1642 domain-containing protein n=1 Tax=Streptococcus suis TaxID=1307 RepID=UPI000CF4A22D|nr:DUF1642 domain-containing protein [Streptococcus suis]
MNKQEAINRVEELYGYGSIAKTVTDIISQIHEPQKVVVPKVVATWIEYCKQSNLDLDHSMRCTRVNNAETGVEEWIYENQETFACAWLFGYEIEQEKLYTVEIPDPNSYCDYRYLSRNDNGICLDASNDTKWKQKKRNQFTESEIKQDFEWAWDAGFAKEVE